MKKRLATVTLIAALTLSACSVPTKSDLPKKEHKVEVKGKRPTISFLGQSSYEDEMNIAKAQLEDAGFNVKMNIQPDYGSFRSQREAGNYDIAIDDWTTVFGDPNYSVSALFKTGGSNSLLSDKHVDKLLNKASQETDSKAKKTYKQLEDEVVFKEGYLAPLYGSKKNLVFDNKVINPKRVMLPISRAFFWQSFDYNNKQNRDKRPLVISQEDSELASLDPIRSIAPSVYGIDMNMYTRLLTLDKDNSITTKGSLSHSYATNKDHTVFYFLLRDDDYFAKVENGKAEKTNERVTADDVKFSLDRARDKNSVPDNTTYNMHSHINNIAKVSNINELKDTQTSNNNSVWDALTKDKKLNVKSLTNNDAAVNNKEGKYQVVKITTDQSMPKEVNYLTHSSAGILSKPHVTAMNNKSNDKPYGHPSTIPTKDSGKNSLYASGPYIMTKKTNYQASFERNPGFNEHEQSNYGRAPIKNIALRFNDDPDSALSELRNHSVDVLSDADQKNFDLIKSDDNLTIKRKMGSESVFLLTNIKHGTFKKHPELRRAVVDAVDQQQYIKFYRGDKFNIASPVTPLLNTGNKQHRDLDDAQKIMDKYQKHHH